MDSKDVVTEPVVATISEIKNDSSGSLADSICNSNKDSPSQSNERCSSASREGDTHKTVFENIQYLGCSRINDPSSESEMLMIMRFLDEQRTATSVTVTLAVPHLASGIVL